MPLQTRTLDDYVEAFEIAHQSREAVDLRSFLPPEDDPIHRTVLRELIRIDLEFGWESNRARSLEEYRGDFPALFDDPDSLQEIAYEEYRLRRRAGQTPNPEEYARRYGIRTDGWPAPAKEEVTDPGSVCLENVARTYRAFCLPPVAAITEQPDSEEVLSVNLENWLPPSGSDGRFVRLFRDLHLADQQAAGQLADGLCAFPSAGEDYLGFRLIGELGRGAFGRVFLARQGALASRPVALKVAPDVGSESQTLAQLQHTHIVPVYSVHRAGSLQAVCMPYCGAVTLADVVRDFQSRPSRPRRGLELVRLLSIKQRLAGVAVPDGPSAAVHAELAPLSFSEAVLWLGARLAGGLHHAHERGILHRDVKPANVLVTDDGLPMLLDFNIAEDVKQRGVSAALVGGTLPYMAPELLSAFQGEDRAVDGRIDVYSLGIVLFELLTGRFPFTPVRLPADSAEGPGLDAVLSRMLDERRQGPPCPRQHNRTISPATAAIVRHCLEPDPARRYPSARALQEDLERQLSSQSLKYASEPSLRERGAKWLRRHPRLAVRLSAVCAVVLCILAGTLTLEARAIERRKTASETHELFMNDFLDADFLLATRPETADKREQAESLCRRALTHYDVLKDDRWQQRPAFASLPAGERDDVRSKVAELLFLLARVISDTPDHQDGDNDAEALLCNERAAKCYTSGEVPAVVWRQRAESFARLNRLPEAAEMLALADRRTAETVVDRMLRARELTSKDQIHDALSILEQMVRDKPDNFWAWHLLERCHFGLGRYQQVVTCCSVAIALKPDFYGCYANRGLAYLSLRQWAEATADFDRVIELKPDRAETYLDRAIAREGLKDLAGAETDLTTALEKGISFTRIYFFRSRIRRTLKNKKGADEDFEKGMRLEPKDELSWIARGFARIQKEPDKALADFDQALKLNPNSRQALMNKAHVLAEIQDKQAESRAVLEQLLKLSPDHVPALIGLAVVLARLDQPKLSRQRVAQALERDTSGQVRYQAGCAFALTSRRQPADADKAIVQLRYALDDHFGEKYIHIDRDLEPLKDKPAFKQLLGLAAMLRERPTEGK